MDAQRICVVPRVQNYDTDMVHSLYRYTIQIVSPGPRLSCLHMHEQQQLFGADLYVAMCVVCVKLYVWMCVCVCVAHLTL